jgi:hypothetical protein
LLGTGKRCHEPLEGGTELFGVEQAEIVSPDVV